MWFSLRGRLIHLLASVSLLERFPSLIGCLGVSQPKPLPIDPHGIPQFILDHNRGWIEGNRHLFDKLDVKEALCNPDSPLRTFLPNKIPDDFFHELDIYNGYGWDDRLGWGNAIDRLREMKSCPAALNSCHTFTVEVHRRSGGKYEKGWEPETPPRELTDLFVDVWQAMPNLATIEWRYPFRRDKSIETFIKAFEDRKMSLPAVRTMKLAPGVQDLVQFAPNLRTIDEADEYVWYKGPPRPGWPNFQLELINGAAKAKNLKEFTLGAPWDVEHLEALVAAMPNLEIFRLEGSVKIAASVQYGRYNDGSGLKIMASILAKLPNLKELHLPCPCDLSIGFDIGIGCSNGCFGHPGAKTRRLLERDRMWARDTAGTVVVKELPNLERFSIGGMEVDPRSGDEKGRLAWPWRGRISEYLLEDTPRYQGQHGPEHEYYGPKEKPDEPIFETAGQDKILLDEDWIPWALGYEPVRHRWSNLYYDEYEKYWAF